MSEPTSGGTSEPRGTSTSAFGTGRRESHDASDFYARFTPPQISTDESVHGAVPELGDGRCFVGSSADMHHLPDNSVALVVTSPPYFVGKEYELAVTAEGELPEKRVPESYFEFLQMLRDVFRECARVLEPGGRIAVNAANLDPDTGRWLPVEQLRDAFDHVVGQENIVTYCGGGIAATGDAFVLALLGRDDVAVYDGSMVEWISDPDAPLEQG